MTETLIRDPGGMVKTNIAWRKVARASLPWVIVASLVALGLWSTLPVAPLAGDAPDTEFSAARAMQHVRRIAREPHPMGSTEIERVRDYIIDEAEKLGLQVELQTVSAGDVFGDRDVIEVTNVIAWIPGIANTKAVMLVAHYDTVPTTAGANDNSAAVAALLETARALQAGPALANDIVFLFTDGEEPFPRFGAPAFAATPGLLEAIGIVVNLEAVGSGGASTLVELNGPESWLIEQFASASPAPAAFSFLTEMTGLIGEIGTDFDVFSDAGLPGMHFAYLRGSPIYHTMADDVGSVRLGTLQHHGTNALTIARQFGNLDLSVIPDSGSSVFFTLRPFFVHYSIPWAVAFAVAAAVLLGGASTGRRRPDTVSPGGMARSAGAALLGALSGAVAGTLVWIALAAVRSSPTIPEIYAYLAVILSLGALFAHWVAGRVVNRDAPSGRHGRVALWVSLALVTAIVLPGFSYLFVWPAAAGVGGLLWHPRRRTWACVRFALVAAPALLLMTPAVDYLFLLAQPLPGNPDSQMTFAAFLPLFLGLLVVALLGSRWHHPGPERPQDIAG